MAPTGQALVRFTGTDTTLPTQPDAEPTATIGAECDAKEEFVYVTPLITTAPESANSLKATSQFSGALTPDDKTLKRILKRSPFTFTEFTSYQLTKTDPP